MEASPKLPFYEKISLILIGIVATLFLLYEGQEIIVPLIFALFAAILLNPVVNWLLRKGVNKLVAITMVVILAVLIASCFLFVMSMQLSMFSKTYPQLKEKLGQTVTDAISWLAAKFNTDASKLNGWIDSTQNEMMKNISSSIGQTLLTVGNALVVIVLIPVYIWLILFYKTLLLEFIRKLFNPNKHKTLVEVLGSIKIIIQSYLAGLLIEGVIVATLNCIGLFALGVEYALILGITGAILNVIPYIGGIVAVALPMIIAFVTISPLSSVLVLIVYMAIQFIDNHYIIPYIVASKVRVNALTAIVVVLVGGALWGVPGMFLSIPLTALLKVIFDHIEQLKPWGFLLGDTMPLTVKLPFLKKQQVTIDKPE